MKATRRSPLIAATALLSILVSLCGAPSGSLAGAKPGGGALSSYAQDLTRAARGAEARAEDYGAGVRRVMQVLSRRGGRNNPVLVGADAAAGASVVEGLARRIAAGDVHASLRGKRVFRLDAGRMLDEAGGAEFARRFAAVLQEAKASGGRAILFLENMDGLLSARDAQQAQAALDSLASEVESGSVRLIGTVSPSAFELKLAQQRALKSRVQEVYLDRADEASQDEEEAAEEDSEESNTNAADFVGDKLSADLREVIAAANASERVSVILQGEDLKNEALRDFIKSSGARVSGSFSGLGAQAVEVPAGAVAQLADLRGVAHLSLDRPTNALGGHVSKTTGKEEVENDEYVSPTGVVSTRKLDGKSIGIAILDSGVYAAHRSFLDRAGKSRIVYSKDFTGENRTDDPYGHGTHVAGLAAGNGQVAGGAYEGVAPDANIVNLRVLNALGNGTVSGLLNALNWVLTNRATYNVKVVNLSLGSSAVESYKNDPVCRAVRKLSDAGVVVVAAAGNDGKDLLGRKIYGQIHSPGDEPSAVTVGASNTFGTDTRADDGVATYSSRGPTRGSWVDASGVRRYDNLIKPDLVAPGNKLISAESASNLLVLKTPSLDRNVSSVANAEMMTLSGTSMATPVVAGSVALLFQVNAKLTPNMVKAVLMYTAQQLRGFNAFEQGAGQLNVAGAITLAKIVRTDLSNSTPVGTYVFTKYPPAPYTTIAGYTFAWSRGVIVGQTFVTGDGLALYQKIYNLGTLMSDGITISEGVIIADRAVWSVGVMMSDSVLTSNGVVMCDGTPFFPTSVLMSDGTMMSDRTTFGDGTIMSDGTVMGDGVVMGDSTKAMTALLSGDATASMTAVADNGVVNTNY
jgi:subtilisin family serine protease